MLKGTGVSQGYGIGSAVLIKDISLDYGNVKYSGADNEKDRLRRSVESFTEQTRRLAQSVRESAGDSEAEILEGHIVMLSDPFMISQMEENIDGGAVAEKAVDTVCGMFIDMFSAVDDELTQQRASDIRNIRDSLLQDLLGITPVDISAVPVGSVLIASDFTPSMTSRIKRENVAAIITEVGGVTSHSAILARAMGIPAVLSVKGALSCVCDGQMLICDGFKGYVLTDPSQEDINEYKKSRMNILLRRKALRRILARKP